MERLTDQELLDLKGASPSWVKTGLFLKDPVFTKSTIDPSEAMREMPHQTSTFIPENHVPDDSCPLGPFSLSCYLSNSGNPSQYFTVNLLWLPETTPGGCVYSMGPQEFIYNGVTYADLVIYLRQNAAQYDLEFQFAHGDPDESDGTTTGGGNYSPDSSGGAYSPDPLTTTGGLVWTVSGISVTG